MVHTIDLSKISYREYRRFFEMGLSEAEECTILGKAAGMTADEIAALPLTEWKRLVKQFQKTAAEPLADPN